jgi:hypothetical protein
MYTYLFPQGIRVLDLVSQLIKPATDSFCSVCSNTKAFFPVLDISPKLYLILILQDILHCMLLCVPFTALQRPAAKCE